MENLTIKDLYRNLGVYIKAGLGDRKIYISSDEEGNEFNPLWFGITADKSEIEMTESVCFINYNDGDNKDNIVLLG